MSNNSKYLDLGITLRGVIEPSQIVSLAYIAENLGYSGVWFTEVAETDAFVMSGVVAQNTKRIKIATGVTNQYLRSPTLIAMSAITVSMLSQGRFILGIGTGTPHFLTNEKPLERFKETLQIISSLIKKGRVEYNGKVFKIKDFELGVKSTYPIPIIAAGLGLKTIKIGAENSDGVLLMLPTLKHAKEAINMIKNIIKKRGVLEDFTIASYFVTSYSDDSEEAIYNAKLAVIRYAQIPKYREYFERLGFKKEMDSLQQELNKGLEEAIETLPDSIVNELIIHGNEEECFRKIEKFINIGINKPIVYPFWSPSKNYFNNVKKTLIAFSKFV